MKRTHKLLAVLLAALMMLAILPVASFAAGANEARKLALLDKVWEPLVAVEKEMNEKKASAAETAAAVYKAALADSRIDEGSLVWENSEQFAFTVEGMHNLYCYRVRNTKHISTVTEEMLEAVTEYAERNNCGGAGSANVLLVGPNYNEACTVPGYYDSSFTNQYINEAQTIANATGGTRTMLGGHNATGPAIAQNYLDKGVVIYDSHGVQSGTSSYLCLTTNTGITSTDYNNGWAVSSGSEAFIDGRYIQNHVSGTLSNCFVWMAICEGMKKAGRGTTGTALLAAGAAGVYGYSQSVSFSGDYKYEKTFWTQMKNGKTVAQAIATMKSTHGNWDPAYSSSSGAAWPIVMSAVDPFPSNPDSAQTVNCDWVLFATTYTVTFKDWDGTVLKTQEVEPGQSATAPANPTRPGYTFTGWDKDFTNVQSNLTVTAQYTANLYTLTIEYVYEDGLQAAEPYVAQLATGETYYVTSPDVPDASPDITDVYGIMPAGDRTVTVTYYYDFVADPIPGDVDGDGVVTMADVTLLAMYLNGENPSITSAGLQNADANASGSVDIRDIAAIYAMIANS